MSNESVAIRTLGKRNALTLTIVGALFVLLGLCLFVSWRESFIVALVCFSAGAVALVLGIAKQIEPEVILRLDAQGMVFFHRRGQLQVSWQNIQRLDLLRVQRGVDWLTLPYLGIKLKAINPVLDTISPRLATGLLAEQRALVMTAVANDDELQSLEHYLSAEFEPLVVNGDRYRGLLAMFGRRCLMLDKYLGFHLYIPVEFLPLAPEQLLRQLREYRQQQLLALDK
ncbi:DUF2982 domain-containing protein [Shewanella dokdonensis]|uniref:DUF2982 domain-containing protein n=2 Tax=Shewanella dokdonensis TaxID=712036 RepID=A0ABX8DFT7_9GAMM|nr:DUF2982 domain-containing protein [Shewanella dokdonensis]MCL1073808.1 DUF2982 domain-containing protein [Shewanella dokdonensis]QVK23599.1 DUF2982 domain-containing protein [Shewanella dokdonensis]